MIFIPYTEADYETATSYLSIADADDLISGQNNNTSWNGYADAVKQILLNQSSLAVDSAFMYQGVKISEAQMLKFPRMEYGADSLLASKVLPNNVKFAVVMMCLQYSNDKAFKNITSETISKLSWSFANSESEVGSEIYTFLKPLQAKTVRLGTRNE